MDSLIDIRDLSVKDIDDLLAIDDVVEDVKRIQEPYKKANRKINPENTVIEVAGTKIGDGNFQVIAGPCSVETEEQMTEAIARLVGGAEISAAALMNARELKESAQKMKEEI